MSGSVTSVDIRVPAELWFDTFLHLPRDTLISVHSVSRTFHRISRPLVFKDFPFHPYGAVYEAISGNPWDFPFLLPDESKTKRTYRRLRFWASESIAPLVQRCTVTPWSHEKLADFTSSCYEGSILSTFFELLGSFTNLQRITFFFVSFDEVALQSLSSLIHLKEIEMDRCSIQPEIIPSTHIKVGEFSFTHLGLPEIVASIGAAKWLPVLDADSLSHLTVLPDRTTRAFLEGAADLRFPNVHTLSVGIGSWTEAFSLRSFPAVRTLSVMQFHPADLSPGLQAALFPLLDAYRGPPELLALLDPTSAPKSLDMSICIPPLFLGIIGNYAHAHCVTSLSLTFDYLRTTTFRALVERFTNLRKFRMTIGWDIENEIPDGEVGYTERTLYEEFAVGSPFAIDIQEITIEWHLECHIPKADVIAARRAARTALGSVHRALEDIYFSSPVIRYTWTKGTEDGQELIVEPHEESDIWSVLRRPPVSPE